MIAIKKLPHDPGPAAWNDILPPQPLTPPLAADVKADWLVIGAGWAGMAAARRLTQICRDDRIVMLEAQRIAEGPNGRNSGFMIDLPHDLSADSYSGGVAADREQTALNRQAIAFACQAAADFAMPEEALRRSGKINGAATAIGLAHNADYARHLCALGEPHEVLDAAAMRRVTGIDFYLGGVYTPGAVMVQPALFMHGMAQGLRTDGVAIYEQSPVVALRRHGGAWHAQTPHGCVTAAQVILAVNGHANSFGFFKRRLMHVHTYASMTRRLTSAEVNALGGQANWGVLPGDPMGTTVRRVCGIGGDRIVVRNRFTYDPSMAVSNTRLRTIARDHDLSFTRRFPMLAEVAMEYRWGGRLCLSRNGVPAFGAVAEGLFAACCQNGLGTSKGTLAGMAAAELAAQLDSPLAVAMLAFDRPRRLPPEPLAWVGANATLRWKERKAGREL